MIHDAKFNRGQSLLMRHFIDGRFKREVPGASPGARMKWAFPDEFRHNRHVISRSGAPYRVSVLNPAGFKKLDQVIIGTIVVTITLFSHWHLCPTQPGWMVAAR